MSIITPPDGVAWRVFSCWRGPPTQRGVMVGELSEARSRKAHFDLYGPATAEFVIDGRSAQCAQIQELSQDVVLYRWNRITGAYEVFFRGPIGHSEDSISETTHTVTFQAADYRAMMARTVLGGPLTWTATEQFVIAQGLQRCAAGYYTTGPPWDIGVAAPALLNPDGTGLAATGTTRDRSYTGAEKQGDMIDELSKVIGGFDWGCDPIDPAQYPAGTAAAQMYVWFPRRGVTKSFVAEYGATVASLSRTVDSTRFANWVRNDGTNSSPGVPLFATSAGDVVANPQLHPEGLWEEGISNASTSIPTTLQQQADGELGIASILTPSYTLTLTPGVWLQKSDCWLGDTIAIRVTSGRLAVNTTARIVQVDFTVDDNGIETVALTVARPVPTLGDVISDQTSRLDALSRR